MAHNVIIGPKGEVVLPLSVRRQLGLKAGDPVAFQVNADGSVTLTAGDPNGLSQAARGLAALRGGVDVAQSDAQP